VRSAPARTLAAAGTAGAGAAAGTAADLFVGGVPGMLYAAGICLAAVVGAVAIVAGRTAGAPEPTVALRLPRMPRLRRVSGARTEPAPEVKVEVELTSAESQLEQHRSALATLEAHLTRQSEAARVDVQRLEQRIRELENERDGLLELVAQEREWFEHTLDALGEGIGRHGDELAELEPELEALIAQ
jgi:flagellar motility protein MotE (MotC chaperone)